MPKTHPVYIQGDTVAGRYHVLDMIDTGGAGQVFKVRQQGLDLPRALKVLRPEVAEDPKFIKPLLKEIRLLSKLTHQNIVKIIDAGEDETKKAVFYVMEYVDGRKLNDAVEQEKDFVVMLALFEQLIDGVCYLHERRILHSDIKPGNVLVDKDHVGGHLHVKILDLGAAKNLQELLPEADQFALRSETTDLTQLIGTRKYAPREWQRDLNTNPIQQHELVEFFPYADLYCLGATLAESVSQTSIRSHIEDELDALLSKPHPWIAKVGPRWNYLEGFIRRLVTKRDSREAFRTAQAAREAFVRLSPTRALPIRVPELTDMGATRAIRARDGMRYFTERTYKVIAHPTFQRLQKLNQLGFVDLVYPWGRHSRFVHSLDVFRLAQRVALRLLNDNTFRLYVEPEDISAFLCAALVHDIGHFPLAHILEDIPTVKPDHTLVLDFLQRDVGASRQLGELIRTHWGVSPETIHHLVDKKHRDKLSNAGRFFQQLLNGPLDIDKMAYVAADSHFTGVPFGEGVDVDFLIGSFVALSKLRYPSLPTSDVVLGIESKGADAAAGLISARASLYGRVYWHHANRAIMAMVKYVTERVFAAKAVSFEKYIEQTWNFSEYEALRFLVEKLEPTDKCSPTNNPAVGILDGSRFLYKRLASYVATRGDESIREAFDALVAADPSKIEMWRQSILEELKHLCGLGQIRDFDVLIDVPKTPKASDAQSTIWVIGQYDPTQLQHLNDYHAVAKSLHEQFVENVSKARVFVSPALRQHLRDAGKEAAAIEAVKHILLS